MFADTSGTGGGAQRTEPRRRQLKRRRKKCGRRGPREGAWQLEPVQAGSREERRRRLPREERPGSPHAQHRWRLHEDLCRHRLVDGCAWPQCNRRCPRVLDPLTGRELRLADLRRSFN